MELLWFVPVAFLGLQAVRLRRGLHVFQLEGYKRHRMTRWMQLAPRHSLLLPALPGKKPLVMTGRATRIYVVGLLLAATVLFLPLLPAIGGMRGRADAVAW